MAPTRSEPPTGSRKYPERENKRSLEETQRILRIAHEKGIDPPELITCNPQGREEHKLNYKLETEIEPRLMEVAYDFPGYSFITVLLDKSRQNPLNKLGGKEAGDKVIEAYWDIAGKAAQLVSAINGSHDVGISLLRVSPFSDEGIIIIGGSELTPHTEIEFREAWLMISKMTDLKSYKYTVDIPSGHSSERFDLNLEAFSKILKWPEIITSATYPVSKPVMIDPDSKGGFIQEVIRRLGNSEIGFYEHMPNNFKVEGELAEVGTRFDQSIMSMGIPSLKEGCVVEIKLEMPNDEALKLLPFTKDGWGVEHGIDNSIGTRKGFAEIFSGVGGMRFLNTFYGKARANRIITPITNAMEDVKKEKKVGVIPISSGYLQYWIDMPASEETLEYLKAVIRRRIKTNVPGDMGYMDIGFEPHIYMIDAKDVRVSDIRDRIILDSMDKQHAPVNALERTDFIINWIVNGEAKLRKKILDSLAKNENGGMAIKISDLKMIDMIIEICDENKGGWRTMSGTEDVVGRMRKDEKLASDIKSKKVGLEDWLFDFAYEKYNIIRLLLTREIKARMEGSS